MKKAPQKAKRPCSHQACSGYATNQGYCDKHQAKIKQRDRDRGTAHQRGYDARWEKERTVFLESNPLCVDHKKRGYIEVATVVDHIVPHKGDKQLFWDKLNWQPLCKPCHDRKTATEDRGAWVPHYTPSKANLNSINPFFAGDQVQAMTGVAFETMQCNEYDIFTVIESDSKSIVVKDFDEWTHRLHHSHFKKAEQ